MAAATRVATATVTAVALVALLPGPAPGEGPGDGPGGAPAGAQQPPELPPFGAPVGDPISTSDVPYSVALSELDGTPVALAAGAGQVQLWNLDTREPIDEPIEHGGMKPWSLPTGHVNSVPVVATTGGGQVRIWDLTPRQPIGPPLQSSAVTAPGLLPPFFDQVAIGERDGRPIAVTAGGNTLAIWDLDTLEPIGAVGASSATGRIESVTIGERNGTAVAVTGGSAVQGTAGVVEVWELDPVRPVAELVAEASWSSNGSVPRPAAKDHCERTFGLFPPDYVVAQTRLVTLEEDRAVVDVVRHPAPARREALDEQTRRDLDEMSERLDNLLGEPDDARRFNLRWEDGQWRIHVPEGIGPADEFGGWPVTSVQSPARARRT